MIDPTVFRYAAAAIAVVLSALGPGIGEGLAGHGAMEALDRQSVGSEQGFRNLVVGLALTETGAILTLVQVLMLLFSPPPPSLGSGIAELGIGVAMGFSAAAIGFASSMAVRSASYALSRQPFFSQKILTFTLLIQSIIEAPVIFAFLVSLLIRIAASSPVDEVQGLIYLSAGLVVGLGCIGPAIGHSLFALNAGIAIGSNKKAYTKILPFSLMSEAIIETPVIFSVLLAFVLFYRTIDPAYITTTLATSFAAAISMGVGATGTGIATGYVASKACRQIAASPENYGAVLRTSLVSQAIIESAAIYALIVAFTLISLF